MQEAETLEPGITTVDESPVIETAPPEIKHLFVPQRLEGESFDEYQMRRYMAGQRLKQMAKGKLIHNSRPNGIKEKGVSYVKAAA
jgi:hypothetical protein